MKRSPCISALILLGALSVAQAQRGTLVFPTPPPPPAKPALPTVWVDTNFQPPAWSASRVSQPVESETFDHDRKQIGGPAALISPERARGILDRFKAAYPRMGSPRMVIYVDHQPADPQSEAQPVPRGETAATTRNPAKAAPSIAYKPTVREVEQAFDRTLRRGSIHLVEQRFATDIIAGKSIAEFINPTDTPQSRQNRAALGKLADVVIELVISSENMSVPTIAATQTIALPNIQATAIRLSDSKILGQASSTDLMNRMPPASLPRLSVPEITEATALALMEDLSNAE